MNHAYTMYEKSSLFWHPSHHVRTLMTTPPMEAAVPYPHFPFFLCTPCHTEGVQNCNHTLDTIYPCVDYRRESVMPSCVYPGFTKILLCGLPCLLSLCTLARSGCEPILLIALLIYHSTVNTCCIASHVALHYTHILIIVK